ncbi:glutathione S-transferase family protein [Pseudomonas capsici]|uniref:Glutathione S-transferase n=1 Tax=Pseudomonas capsici TaxID=2810614 RepID=A0ABT3C5A3_9PSED|nr:MULTISPECIES: glutathione S-transferase [Pseudomonas]MBN6714304.1 glutathione S-transferase [Pseudomonas capsici]MBN6719140.1 glutathione S-transferase [Pseudomonas capsici]MBN6723046.1 glutathione S-transferase [Pseudomonas capsici]MBX8474401.1 glutathione S-transferase [Pseudomonas cichorii]MBX8608285.1 glutathione S-transferase [Pseudomonas cichorii]
MKLYDLDASGNCYKVRLFAALANIELDVVAVDFLAGEHKKPPLSDMNPLGQLPVLEDGSYILRDSQAILVYLAGQYGGLAWWPAHPQGQADIVQWLSFAGNEVQHSLCAARLVQKFGVVLDKAQALEKSSVALSVLDRHLEHHDWLAIGRPTIADCAVYPYVVLAPEGGVDLAPYANIARWMARIEALPGYLPKP